LSTILVFWQTIARLKEEKRKGWKKLKLGRSESVADHSYAVAMLALFIGDLRRLNVKKLVQLALLHDLEEAVTGDLTPEDKTRRGEAKVRRDRQEAVERLLKLFPPRVRHSYRRLWTDLRLRHSKEAQLVHELDKIELAFQANQYSKRTGRRKVADFYLSARKEIHDLELQKTLESLTSKSN